MTQRLSPKTACFHEVKAVIDSNSSLQRGKSLWITYYACFGEWEHGGMVAQNGISHWISYWVNVKGKKNIISYVFAPVSNFRQTQHFVRRDSCPSCANFISGLGIWFFVLNVVSSVQKVESQ
jgi:hypothetical protein